MWMRLLQKSLAHSRCSANGNKKGLYIFSWRPQLWATPNKLGPRNFPWKPFVPWGVHFDSYTEAQWVRPKAESVLRQGDTQEALFFKLRKKVEAEPWLIIELSIDNVFLVKINSLSLIHSPNRRSNQQGSVSLRYKELLAIKRFINSVVVQKLEKQKWLWSKWKNVPPHLPEMQIVTKRTHFPLPDRQR